MKHHLLDLKTMAMNYCHTGQPHTDAYACRTNTLHHRLLGKCLDWYSSMPVQVGANIKEK